jgi:hypothetical protein
MADTNDYCVLEVQADGRDDETALAEAAAATTTTTTTKMDNAPKHNTRDAMPRRQQPKYISKTGTRSAF